MDPRNGKWVLPSLEYSGDLAELEADARRQVAQAEREGPPSDRPVGTDSTNSIWITVDADNLVESIEISRRWKDQLDSTRFGAALFEAYGDALSKALGARAIRALAAKQERSARGEPAPATDEWGEREVDVDDETWFRELQASVERLSAQLDAYRRMAAEGGATEEYERELKSPNEMFTMRLQGPAVVAITGDVMQIRRADAEQLRLEALDLFRAAQLTSTG